MVAGSRKGRSKDLETGPINYNIPEDSLYYILKQSVYKYLENKKRGEEKKNPNSFLCQESLPAGW